MTNDSGFAPNPFHGFLTLATCKPGIRRNTQIGDYVAGFTSVKLCRDLPGNEKLVFIMRVTEKLTFSEYWFDKRFKLKKPTLPIPKGINCINQLSTINDKIRYSGDNIYQSDTNPPIKFTQRLNINHCDSNNKTDLGGKYVLVSGDFYYFGRYAIELPFEINLPNGQSSYGSKTENIDEILTYIETKYGEKKNTCIGYPHGWGII